MMASSFNMLGHTKVVKYLPDSHGLRTEDSSAKCYAPKQTAFKQNKTPTLLPSPTSPLNKSASAWEPRLIGLHQQLPYDQLCLRHRRNGVVRRAHLGKDFIQPLQGPVKMNLNPAWGACHILSMVLCTPTLKHKCNYVNSSL